MMETVSTTTTLLMTTMTITTTKQSRILSHLRKKRSWFGGGCHSSGSRKYEEQQPTKHRFIITKMRRPRNTTIEYKRAYLANYTHEKNHKQDAETLTMLAALAALAADSDGGNWVDSVNNHVDMSVLCTSKCLQVMLCRWRIGINSTFSTGGTFTFRASTST